jgi:hypothetical protein
MRKDMSKVIVERPRRLSRLPSVRRFKRLDAKLIAIDDDEDDGFPSQMGLGKATQLKRFRKQLNENLAPLKRYLMQQVGRRWDAVWSEICAHLKPTSTVQQHVRDHVEDFIATRTMLIDGAVWVHCKLATGPYPLAGENRYGQTAALYVDPVTGIVRRNPHYRSFTQRKRDAKIAQKKKLDQRVRRLATNRLLMRLDDGNWWDVTVATHSYYEEHAVVDVIELAGLSSLPRLERYGQYNCHATAKRPLSKAGLKRHRLRNA